MAMHASVMQGDIADVIAARIGRLRANKSITKKCEKL
jgi:hypothetical protein